MKIRFIGDYDFNGEIIDGLIRREPFIDFLSGFDAQLIGLSDSDVLQTAANCGRVLVTHDKRTMPHHFGEFVPSHQSPGVFILPQRLDIGIAINELLLIWSTSEAEEWANRILYLPL